MPAVTAEQSIVQQQRESTLAQRAHLFWYFYHTTIPILGMVKVPRNLGHSRYYL